MIDDQQAPTKAMSTNAESSFCAKGKETVSGESVVSALWRVLKSCDDICSFTVTTLSWSSWVSRCSMPSQKLAAAPSATTTATSSLKSQTILSAFGGNVRYSLQQSTSVKHTTPTNYNILPVIPHSLSHLNKATWYTVIVWKIWWQMILYAKQLRYSDLTSGCTQLR